METEKFYLGDKAVAVGLKVKYNWYQIGGADFLYAFFSTIAYNLENREWGSRFPAIMDDLYQDKVDYCNIDAAEKELLAIKEELKEFPASKIVWDIDDMSKLPPWGTNISSDIKNLSNYFLTSDGENVFDTFFRAIDKAKLLKANLEIKEL